MVISAKTPVLIVVKAAPQPSRTYGETVCVAGLTGTPSLPTWIRLYPVPFRYLEGEHQFSKYDLIEVVTRDAGGDKRPESRKIVIDGLQRTSHLQGWRDRAPWVESLDDPTMCELLAAIKEDLNAQSLAAVRPREAFELTFEHHPGWSRQELQRFVDYRNQGELFSDISPSLLEAPRFIVRLTYTCQTKECPRHHQRIIDWELNALQFRFRNRSDDELRSIIKEKFLTQPFADHKEPLIFVGNQENPQRRRSFTVLGLYYPNRVDADKGRTLF